MPYTDAQLSTGLPGLDRMLGGILPGDNIVWQVGSVDHYIPFVKPFYKDAVARGRKLVYFRFARHARLVPENVGAEVRKLNPEAGFETLLDDIHTTIEAAGRGAFYVFDCISDLAVDWYSDRMVGNFFMLTCPYLYDLETIAYFAVLRDNHSMHATEPILETTQLFLDVYSHKEKLYVHPLKVQHRYSPTMHLLHAWEGDEFVPVTESYTIADILKEETKAALGASRAKLGVWHRTFIEASRLVESVPDGWRQPEEANDLCGRMLRMIISRDERVLRLAEKYLDLRDLVAIGNRMIGTGLIGGKSVGMLLARAILEHTDPRWSELLEVHDSFYIGSDVFYTFLVRNGCWWMRQEQKNPSAFLGGAERARQRILMGSFPDYIEQQFSDMLDYFGQSPIIVRSSSLLEDNFGNAFAGKYDSIFSVNQGSRHKRLEDFISAVKTIYASTMSEKALRYRAQRGILDRDEQMALLVQRVSGSVNGGYFYPHIAGVGFSFNPYKWSEYIVPEAGMLRLVFGLGTRAVDRADDDYTRLIALNAPERRPEANFEKMRRFSQRKVDVLDLEGNLLNSVDFADVARNCPRVPLRLFAARDQEMEALVRERGARQKRPKEVCSWMLTFDGLIENTPFIQDAADALQILQTAYEYPVDIEFTANFFPDNAYRINLLQCRPLQVKGSRPITPPPTDIAHEDLILRTHGPVIGQSRIETVDRLIYVVPSVYGQLPISERYTIARLIGQVAHAEVDEPSRLVSGTSRDGSSTIGAASRPVPSRPQITALLGPGRWGTTTPSLGVPVSFAEINTVSIICEIVAMRDDLVPDVSLGTHFLSELVEMDILYMAVFPTHEGSVLNHAFFEHAPNRLAEVLPRASAYAHVIKVIDTAQLDGAPAFLLNADNLNQKVVCYLDRKSAK